MFFCHSHSLLSFPFFFFLFPHFSLFLLSDVEWVPRHSGPGLFLGSSGQGGSDIGGLSLSLDDIETLPLAALPCMANSPCFFVCAAGGAVILASSRDVGITDSSFDMQDSHVLHNMVSSCGMGGARASNAGSCGAGGSRVGGGGQWWSSLP